jgi:hypothetical protein
VVAVVPKYLPIDKRCEPPDVDVAEPDADPELDVIKRADDGVTRNEPARVGPTRVDADAADAPLYVPAPPNVRTAGAAIAFVAKPAHNTHKTDIVDIFNVCFFILFFPRLLSLLFYHICESVPNTFLVKIHIEYQSIMNYPLQTPFCS